MKTITATIREKWLAPIIREAELIYQTKNVDIQYYQLMKFNNLWANIQSNVPYYQNIVKSGIVPSKIKCWDDFAKFPILTRSSLQEDSTRYIDSSQEIVGWSTTGGSTGTPFRVPYGPLESQTLMSNAWIGRDYYNIRVSDRMFSLWGHSHLFGTGWRRYVKKAKTIIKNQLLGNQVFSGYHLTPQRLRLAADSIIKMRPDFIMGYSRSLVMLAKENTDRAYAFRQIPIKAVIATTEAFGQPCDGQLIEQVFGCRIAMEYGAAETGVIAYTHPSDNRYKAFWNTYLLEAVPINQTDAKLLLTSLYSRAMPLIRYDIGDVVRNYEIVGNSIISFDSVLGRDNDLIEIVGGAFIHPVALIHCIQFQFGVLGIQIVQEKDNSVSISIMCEEPLSKESEAIIRRNLSTLHPRLSECKIIYVNQLEQTLAGKTKWVVKR